jgi:hypothetical protein
MSWPFQRSSTLIKQDLIDLLGIAQRGEVLVDVFIPRCTLPQRRHRWLRGEVLQLFDFAEKPLASAILQKSRSLIVRHLGKAVFEQNRDFSEGSNSLQHFPFKCPWSLRFVRRVIKQKRTRRRGTSL